MTQRNINSLAYWKKFRHSLFFVAGLILLVCVIAGAPATLLAQNTGEIFGRVTDTSDAIISGARITAQSPSTGLSRSTFSNTDGGFTLPALPIGTYTVTVEGNSFKKFVNTNVIVDAEHSVRLDVSLQPGAVTQEVTVSDLPPQIDLGSPTNSTLVRTELIQDLPMNGRNIISMAQMLPGVTNITAPALFTGDRNGPTLNASGARSSSNLLLLDGVMHNSLFRGTGQNYPPPDALAQVEVLNNQYSAQYGHFNGAILNVLTKSGGNAFHGATWEYVQNTAFNASNYLTKLTPASHQNQFGTEISGPILHDRLFFTASYEGIRFGGQGTSSSATPPTTAERTGDFTADVPAGTNPSAYLQNPNNPAGKNFATLSPLLPAGCAAALGTGKFITNATIPAVCLNSVSQTIDNRYIPTPNGLGGTLIQLFPNPSQADNGFGRLDWHFGKHTIDGRYYLLQSHQLVHGNLPLYEVLDNDARNQSVSINDTYVFSTQLLNVFRVGYNRMAFLQVPTDRTSLQDLGSTFPVLGPKTLPAVSVTSRMTLASTSTNDQHDINEDFDLVDQVSYTKGNHSLQFGAEYLRLQYLNRSWFESMGSFSFSGTYTGNAMADYLFGFSNQIVAESPHLEQSGIQSNMFLFAQDNWKVLPRLTLNLGLRYELAYPWYQPQDYWGTFAPGIQSTKFPTAPRGLLFPGDPGVPRGMVPTRPYEFAPRIGFALDPLGNGKTSIRGGFGIFYDAIDSNIIQNVEQPFVYQFTLSGPFGFSNPLIPTIPTTVNLQNPVFTGTPQVTYPSPQLTVPYVESFNFGVQQQLMRNLSIDVEYVGKLGRHQLTPFFANPAVYSSTATTANTDARRIYKGFGNNTEMATIGSSSYHALQVQVSKRLGSWISAQGAYTYSRSLDNFSSNTTDTALAPQILNPNTGVFSMATEFGPSTFNATHIASLGYTVYGPKFSGQNAFLRLLAGGWTLSGIFAVRSGFPLNITLGQDIALSGTGNQRPNLIGDPVLSSDRSKTDKINQWFNNTGNTASVNTNCGLAGAAFCAPAAGTFGNLSRDALIGPGNITNNMSIAKNIPIPGREGMHLQFRCEAFGVFNTPNLGTPGTSPGKTFGVITSTSGNRFLQMSLHLWY